jgi:hypothetical protein
MDLPAVRLSDADVLTLRHLCEGTLIEGGTGAGKTSGSGRLFSDAFLKLGLGGVVFTVKPGETGEWVARAKAAGREADLILFGPDHPPEFNPLLHEATRKGRGGGLVENVVALLAQLDEISDPGADATGDAYFRAAGRDCLRMVLGLLLLADAPLTIGHLYQVLATAPVTPGQAGNAEWMRRRFTGQLLEEAARRVSPDTEVLLGRVENYFLVRFPGFPDKTRACIVESLLAKLSVLSSGPLERLFGRGMTWTPAETYRGRITVIDMPVLEYGEAGRLAACLLKTAFMRDVQRREVRADTRPVFIWIDEYQYVMTSHDQMFLTTARSSRCATVFLTQNNQNLFAALGGGPGATPAAYSLLGNLRTKVMHAQEEVGTAEYFSTLVGFEYTPVPGWSVPTGPESRGPSGQGATASMSMQRIYRLDPVGLQGLKTGGPEFDYQVEGYVFRGGQLFSNRKNHLLVTVDQRRGEAV